MPEWSNPDPGDDDQDKANPDEEPEPEPEAHLFATFMWWLVVLPLGVAILVILAIRYHDLLP